MNQKWNFNNSYLNLPKVFYSYTHAEKFLNLEVVTKNNKLINELNIENKNFNSFIIDSIRDRNIKSFSQSYAGHQFGNFTILGDGRATFLGEHLNLNNERYDIQLKGSGKTPYSRNGDGKGTLKSMLREFIISEAMHNLNIKTTRSLAVLKTGEKILRTGYESGGILVRVAKSHIRVGTFQLAQITNKKENIKELLDYSIERLYPELNKNINKYLIFFEKVTENQMSLIVDWQRVGFIHGVMNTDNMSLSGETIDYGPCAFLDEYNPNKVFSSIDRNGRYSFNNQPKIALWNLARLGETLLHLIDEDEILAIKKIEEILKKFEFKYYNLWLSMMKKKININQKHAGDLNLIKELLDLMHVFKLDYTNTFINIQNHKIDKYPFMKDWALKLSERKKLNNKIKEGININPYIIPRNHIIDKILNDSDDNNFNKLKEVVNILKKPYSHNISDKYTEPPKEEEKIHQTFCGT